jgi:adenine/guanine phosphoribosyltransferase-like PRPP-binding protein
MARAKALADAYSVPFIIVHHTRKLAATDFLDEVSGSQGLAGSADAVLVLKRLRGNADGI